MLTKIKRQDCLKLYPKFPTANYHKEIYFNPKVVSSHLLTLHTRSLKEHINQLSRELARLIKELNYNSLIFLGDNGLPWLNQDNSFQPAKEALEYLAKNNVGKRFSGALWVETCDLPVFLRHLAWLVRCNGSLPLIHFMDPGQQLLGSVCQYANLHLSPLSSETEQQLTHLLPQTPFVLLDGNHCYEQYSETGIIKGRKIKV